MKFFHRHDWLKWSKLVDGYNGKKLQFRSCNTCGRTQRRSIGTCDQANVALINTALAETMTGDDNA